ncbi:hypothetical protein GGD88_003657, partial [Roseospira goensis]|nr:hypothetical protein [Roseospira goensis]
MTEHADTTHRSSTAIVLDELQLYGYHPFAEEPDPRPLPEAEALQGALADISGSSRNSGVSGADLEKEVGVIPETVGHPLDDL